MAQVLLSSSGFITAWVFLRFYQYRNGVKGDPADAFGFESFFPTSLQCVSKGVQQTGTGCWRVHRARLLAFLSTPTVLGSSPTPPYHLHQPSTRDRCTHLCSFRHTRALHSLLHSHHSFIHSLTHLLPSLTHTCLALLTLRPVIKSVGARVFRLLQVLHLCPRQPRGFDAAARASAVGGQNADIHTNRWRFVHACLVAPPPAFFFLFLFNVEITFIPMKSHAKTLAFPPPLFFCVGFVLVKEPRRCKTWTPN